MGKGKHGSRNVSFIISPLNETYKSQTNSNNPNPWEKEKRYNNSEKPGQAHFNKEEDKYIYEPHVHDPSYPGGVRPAEPWEIPG